MESIIAGLELSGEGGLRLVGWLETDQGVVWPLQEPGDCLVWVMLVVGGLESQP